MRREECAILSFYAVSPIHAGSGASVATVDLPIQRERHTGYPHIQASSVKGAMRDHFRKFFDKSNYKSKISEKQLDDLINYIFGSDEQDGWKKNDESQPASISVSDAKLLAFPMRSDIAPFVWVTSPTILKRLKTDLEFINENIEYQDLKLTEDGALNLIGNFQENDKIILEDAVVQVKNNFETGIVDSIKKYFNSIKKYFHNIDKLLLVSDEMFDYCVSSCTEIQTNIKIDSKTGTAEEGGLRYQEFLPSDTVLYNVVYFGTNSSKDLTASVIKDCIKSTIKDFIQIGGDVTLGKGICKIEWIDGGSES